MNARHVIEKSEMFMGEMLTYYVTVFESLPAPSQENPYCEGGRCFAPAAPIANAAPALPAPVAKRTPSKAEYLRSFELAGALPECVGRTMVRNLAWVAMVRDAFVRDDYAMPRRLRRALDRLDFTDLAGHYDAGAIGRASHYLTDHQGRVSCVEHASVA